MYEQDPPKLSEDDKEALATGRVVMWVKRNWQFIVIAGLVGGPNAASVIMPKHEEPTASQDVRLAVVETKLQSIGEQMGQINAKLDRALSRRNPAPGDELGGLATPPGIASIVNGDVSRALRLQVTPTPDPSRLTP